MPPTKQYSAAEIAAMKLPGLPATKARVIQRATAEGWSYEEMKGVGGTRRMYSVPEKYLPAGASTGADVPANDDSAVGVIGAITSAGRADPVKLALAIRAFEEFAASRSLVISSERKADVIALLYDYLAKGAGPQDVDAFLRIVG